MISAHEARKITVDAETKAYETDVFKHAIKKLESAIKNAAQRGEHEISYNNAFFDLCDPDNHIEKHATEADLNAIGWFMKENGYNFLYYAKGWNSHNNNWFRCRW